MKRMLEAELFDKYPTIAAFMNHNEQVLMDELRSEMRDLIWNIGMVASED